MSLGRRAEGNRDWQRLRACGKMLWKLNSDAPSRTFGKSARATCFAIVDLAACCTSSDVMSPLQDLSKVAFRSAILGSFPKTRSKSRRRCKTNRWSSGRGAAISNGHDDPSMILRMHDRIWLQVPVFCIDNAVFNNPLMPWSKPTAKIYCWMIDNIWISHGIVIL